ncbi:sushi domain-containing protein 6-like [Rhinatrema bivittatum]|uniref:sushi domain-containing protein 6-like n=1 Tax=Rhinatrema bivittatum TaxID=194408 RepID=UPI00112B4B97|nr:sushi domain-containing protein 6-like [Rhinatrema bivittatum]
MGSVEVRLGLHVLAPVWPVILLFLLCFVCPFTSQKIRDCQWPQPPEHGGFRCASCPPFGGGKAFTSTVVEYYCKGGYTLSSQSRVSICRKGKWTMTGEITCQPLPDSTVDSTAHGTPTTPSFPIMAVVAVTVSSLLLTAMVCVLLKPISRCCQGRSNYRRMEEPDILIVNGHPVLLPSYEEAVYGPQGNRNPMSSPSVAPISMIWEEGQTPETLGIHQLVRGSQVTDQNTSMSTPPPAYEEVQSSARHPPSVTDQEGSRVPPLHFLFSVPTTK